MHPLDFLAVVLSLPAEKPAVRRQLHLTVCGPSGLVVDTSPAAGPDPQPKKAA